MTHAWKWLRRTLITAAFATAACLAAWVAVVPSLVQRLAAGQLAGMGLRSVALQIRGLSLRHVQMANLAAGQGERLRVGAVGIGFSLGGLLGGRLRVIELTGLETEVRLRDGTLDLGPLADLGSGRGGGENPFDEIRLRSSAVLLDLGGRRLQIPVEGTIRDAGAGRLDLDVRVDAEGCAAALTGTVDTSTNGLDLALKAQVREVAALVAALPPQWATLPVKATGSASIEASCSQRKGPLTLRAALRTAGLRLSGDLGGRRFSADVGLSARATVTDGRVEGFWCRMDNGGVSLDGLPSIGGLHLVASLQGGVLAVPHASARGPGWALELDMCGATGVLDALAGKATPIIVHLPWWRCSLEPQQIGASIGEFRTASPQPVDVMGQKTVVTLAPGPRDSGSAWTWQVQAPDVVVSWGDVDLQFASPRATLQGVAAKLRLAAEANARAIKVQVLPGSRVSCAGASGSFSGLTLAVPRGEGAGVEVSVREQKGEVWAALGDATPAWGVRVPELAAAARGAHAEGPMGLVAAGIAASGQLALEAGPEKAVLSLRPGSGLTVSAARLPAAGAEATGLELHLGEREARAAASLKEAKLDWDVQAPDLRFGLGRAKAELPGGVAADGVAVYAQLGVRANPREAVLTVAGGSDLIVGSMEFPWLDIRKAAAGPLLCLELGEKGLEARMPLGGEKPAWALGLAGLAVKLAEADLVLPDRMGRVEGCRGELRLSGTATPLHLEATLLGGCSLGFQAVEATVGSEAVRVGPNRLELAPGRSFGAIGLEAGQPVSARAVLELQSGRPVAAGLGQQVGATLGAVSADACASWSAAKGGVVFGKLSATGVEARVERRLGDSVLKARVPNVEVHVDARADFSAGRGPERPLSFGFALATKAGSQPVTAGVAGAAIAIEKGKVAGTVALGDARPPMVVVQAFLDGASVRHKASGLSVEGLSASVPLSWNGARPAALGSFFVDTLGAAGASLRGISGTLGLADMRAEFTAACEPLKGAKLSIEGSLDASQGEPRGAARLSLPLFKLDDEHELGRRVPQLRGLLATGTFGVEGFARLSDGQMRPTLTLTVLEGVLKSRQWDMEAEGVFATVRLSSLSPPLTPRKELQIALVQRAKMGALEVEQGTVAFRLEPAGPPGAPSHFAAVIQRADWGWCGGRLYVEDFSFNPQAAEHRFTLHAADLKLEALAALLPDQQVTGVGTLSGRLPVRIAGWPNIRFGSGYLHSLPNQRGWLRIRDLGPIESTIAAVAEASVPEFLPARVRAEGREQLRESMLTALREFEYDVLKLDFIDRGEETLARLTTSGRGRNPDRWGLRYPIGGIELNLVGLDKELLNHILRFRPTD